jgi:uncharacterized membrane protein YciS (DUF1049 family)
MSGWGDEKSAPMMVVAPGAVAASSGRITTMLLGAGLVIALAIAGYSMFRVDVDARAHAKAVKELTEKHTTQTKVLEEKLSRSNVFLKEDKEFIEALEADNAAMASGKKPTVAAPVPPPRQKYIDDLQRENAERRGRGSRPVTPAKKPDGFSLNDL